MTISVLVVDDSSFIRRRIVQILGADPELRVVGTASDGQKAVNLAAQLNPDVITMDVEMPIMNGITAVKEIMKKSPCPILMFSSSTRAGAKATLDALEAGALDFLPKELDQIDKDRFMAEQQLRERVRAIGQRGKKSKTDEIVKNRQIRASNRVPVSAINNISTNGGRGNKLTPQLLVIAASTGGPVAIQKLLTQLPDKFPIPVLLLQHMPANFTPSFAERLDKLCNIRVKQADEGDVLEPGLVLLAPGGKQTTLKRSGGKIALAIRESQSGECYQPCADVTFESVAEQFPGKVLVVVLTGMGSDGCEGARSLKRNGSILWAQDKKSCTVYGMPRAVSEAGLADRVLGLNEIAEGLVKL